MCRFLVALALVVGPLAAIAATAGPAEASVIPITGPVRLGAGQLAGWFSASTRSPYRATVPVDVLASYFVAEGQAAGVRGDIAFAQSVLETGWFSFPAGGYVQPTDNNFAGIGAYGDGSHLFRAPDAQLGVRAQMQLLRRYADPGSNQTNIGNPPVAQLWNPPSRYDAPGGTHGWAPTWQSLSGTWASSTSYSDSILRLYNSMLRFAGQPTDCPPATLAVGATAIATAGCPADIAAAGRALVGRPGGGYYVLNGNGAVTAFDGAPGGNGALFPWDIARDLALTPDGNGYVVLDGWGGVHPFGNATGLPIARLGSYWPGWDIARSVAITADGGGLAVLDGWGGVHAAGDARSVTPAYWPGWDIARSLALTWDNHGTYVLDGWGGVHADGSATPLGSPYWPGWDIARDILASGDGARYAVLDGFGGIHGYGGAAGAITSGYVAADQWRSLSWAGGSYRAVRNDGTTQAG